MRITLGFLRWSWLREQLNTSLWITPVGVTVTCAATALGLVQLDRALSSDFAGWYVYGGQAEGARELLSIIASSMLTITGLVFSITILVLQLASSQFSPRVLRTFLQDSVTQWAMGMFLGSFVYALVLLPQVRSNGPDGEDFVPGVAVFVALMLALASVAFFVRYIHHMAHAIRASTIVARVTRETHESIARMYPDDVLEDYVQLSFEEIRRYGSNSVQIIRRARTILRDLISVANQDRAQLLKVELAHFERIAARELSSPCSPHTSG